MSSVNLATHGLVGVGALGSAHGRGEVAQR
ncbi:hypothetical protein RQN9TF_32960 (plasmid) [Rhodococcus qingshengii]|nr:hypothetical protein RQN9TF_32960 [Rhodococcus qingshengii]